MFKVGDKVRIKDNVDDIVREMDENGIMTVEFRNIAQKFAGKSSVIEGKTKEYYKVFGWYWGEYSLEHDFVTSISGYNMLL